MPRAIADEILHTFYMMQAKQREAEEIHGQATGADSSSQGENVSGESIAELVTTKIMELTYRFRSHAHLFRLLARLSKDSTAREELVNLLLSENTHDDVREFLAEMLAHGVEHEYSGSYEVLHTVLYKAAGRVYDAIAHAVSQNDVAAKTLGLKAAPTPKPY